MNNQKKKWYQKIPNAYVLLLLIIILATIMTYIIPAGQYSRKEMSNGRIGVVPGSFEYIEQTPVGIVDMFRAIPEGMVAAASIVFIVFFAGALFKVIESTGALENGIGVIVRKLQNKSSAGTKMIWIMTFIYGILGAIVGFENNIALVPIGILIALAMNYDLVVGTGIAIAGIGLGFATSPINPYTVGVSHAIAGLPIFSGFGLRSLFLLSSLAILAHHTTKYAKKITENKENSLVTDISTEGLELTKDLQEYKLTGTHKAVIAVLIGIIVVIVFGTLKFHWYITEITTVFLIGAIIAGIVAGYNSDKLLKTMVKGASELTGGALIIGVARGISVVLDKGNIGDTIIHALAAPLQNVPSLASGLLMSVAHSIINFFIPSGSGQAMATMPIMVPLSDLVGITRQTAVLAFQIGDGIMNLVVPTLGGLLAMLAIARVPFDRWFKFIYPMVLKVLLVGWIFTTIAVMIGY